jgi:clan AA aspartic protease (TIGR02281 family)
MDCPKCQKEIPKDAKFCPHCGTHLRQLRAVRPPIFRNLFIGLALFIALAFWGYHWYLAHIPESHRQNIDAPGPSTRVAIDPPRPTNATPSDRSTDERLETPVGRVVIRDITGHPIARLPAALLQGGWLAIPDSTCLGGYTWTFELRNAPAASIDAGIIGAYDRVGIWQAQLTTGRQAPALGPWQPNAPLSWKSIVSDHRVAELSVSAIDEQRFVTWIRIPETMDEPGVFVQGDRIVGWTFGPHVEGGFVWKDLESERLNPTISVYDYYRATFADSREEHFLLAQADRDAALIEQLAGFAQGFRKEPRLSPDATPSALQREAAIAKMRKIVAQLLQQGDAAAVAGVFDGTTLAATASVDLMADVVQAVQIGFGFESAVLLMEELAYHADVLTPAQRGRFDAIYSDLYLNWLIALLEIRDTAAFWNAFERAGRVFPDHPPIQLAGVKMALKNDDWMTAERLLYMTAYPEEYADQVQLVQSEITRLKSREGKIVLRFKPGARQVPAEAVLNGSYSQRFIIDTGASMTTIPLHTAKQLGLALDPRTPLRRIYTAGGMKEAHEVTLDSITLGAWRVDGVQVLVLDLPGQPRTGLLGMNYLQRFQIDLNSTEGILTLAPR